MVTRAWVRVECWDCAGHGQKAIWSFGVKEPEECGTCGGSGRVIRYTESGVYAKYPGGPLLGRDTKPTAEARR